MNILVVGVCIAWLAGGISFTFGIALNRPSRWAPPNLNDRVEVGR